MWVSSVCSQFLSLCGSLSCARCSHRSQERWRVRLFFIVMASYEIYALFLLGAFFFFNDTATTEIYTLSLHDALPILAHDVLGRGDAPHEPLHGEDVRRREHGRDPGHGGSGRLDDDALLLDLRRVADGHVERSEEHTSELQSQSNLVCRLLLEKKKKAA